MPLLTRDVLQAGPVAYGALWSLFSVGWFLGGIATGAWDWRGRFALALSAVPVLWGLVTVGLAFSATLVGAGAAMAASGLAYSPFGILARSVRQRTTPEDLRGRVFAVAQAVMAVGSPLGSGVGGYLTHLMAAPFVIFVAGVFSIAVGVGSWLSRGLRGFDAEAPATVS